MITDIDKKIRTNKNNTHFLTFLPLLTTLVELKILNWSFFPYGLMSSKAEPCCISDDLFLVSTVKKFVFLSFKIGVMGTSLKVGRVLTFSSLNLFSCLKLGCEQQFVDPIVYYWFILLISGVAIIYTFIKIKPKIEIARWYHRMSDVPNPIPTTQIPHLFPPPIIQIPPVQIRLLW